MCDIQYHRKKRKGANKITAEEGKESGAQD
jgi:hypothetical protein